MMPIVDKVATTRSASATVQAADGNAATVAEAVAMDAASSATLSDHAVDAMLATMKQSAQRLDDLLQRLCESHEATDDGEEAANNVVDMLAPVAGLQHAQQVGVESYFEAIVQSFEEDAVKVFALQSAAPDAATTGNGSVWQEGLAKDATFLFSADVRPLGGSIEPTWVSADVQTLVQFQRHVAQCLSRVDPSIPDEISLAIGLQLAAELRTSDGMLVVIQAVYPPQCVDVQARVEWRCGNRVSKIHARERAWQRQWGLQIVLTIDCVARAQAQSSADPSKASLLGPALSCLLTSRVFVPKKAYLSLPLTSVDVSMSLRLSRPSETSNGHSLPVEAVEIEDKVLPELLSVYHYGSHATLHAEAHVTTSNSAPAAFDSTRGFQELHINTPLPRNRIIQAACGRVHSLLLNDQGLVFAYGHAVDGCLGHGDTVAQTEMVVSEPKLVEFFVDKAIVVASVACGGDDLTGFHSAAATRDGAVYAWGVGIALGLGSVYSKSLPELVPIPPLHPDTDAKPTTSLVESIACGSGFCVAITQDGHAYSWGKWSDGRLGLGTIPIVTRSSRLHGSHRQLQRFQLHPKRIGMGTAHGSWRKIACGDAHCIGMSRDGRLFTWGRGRQGQLGLGDGRSAMAPVLVPSLAKASWRDVAAGQDWSMAVDSHGAVWSWGACGAAVLGQCCAADADTSATMAELLLQKQQQLQQQQQQAQSVSEATGGLALPRFLWLWPRPIPFLSHGDVSIRRIDAGARHAAAVSMQGDLYVWGSPAQGLPGQPTLVASQQMHGAIVEQVFCGGNQIIALASGSFLARDLQQLHRALQAANEAHASHRQHDAQHRNASATAGADVVLLVGGGRALYAHKLVLARRSAVLRALILNEERAFDHQDAYNSTGITELLLPQLRVDVARLLLEFVYTDNLTKSLDPLSYLIRDVLRAARQFKIPRLVRICRERITSAAYVPLEDMEEHKREDQEEEELVTQGHALNQDLAFAFGDSTWADLRLVAENRAIPVHRGMLVARSEYFRALLAFPEQQQQLQSPERVHTRTELVVDESYVGMLRVLRFIYNDELTTLESDEDNENRHDVTERLLEDLIAADKYGLVRMKRLCEHHIVVTTTNCVDVLVVADLVHAQHLKQIALTFIQTHLYVLTASASTRATRSVLQRLAAEFPSLLSELHDATQQHAQQQMLLRDWQKQLETQWKHHHDTQATQWRAKQAQTQFPWVPLILALVSATLYLAVMNAHESDYPLVPAINVVALGGLFALAVLGKL